MPTKDVVEQPEIAKILKGTNFLLNQLAEYTTENPTSVVEMFKIVHNFHRLVIKDVAAKWAKGGTPEEHIYRMADMTWRKAMRELQRQLKPLS